MTSTDGPEPSQMAHVPMNSRCQKAATNCTGLYPARSKFAKVVYRTASLTYVEDHLG